MQRLAILTALVIFALTTSGVVRADPGAATSADPTPDVVSGEKTLQARLMAPCCWNQTLDIHESPVSAELREEIHRRLVAGESATVIEEDIVARYGERIRAVPKGKSLTGMGVWLSIFFVAAGLGAAGLVVRWARRGRLKQRPKDDETTSKSERDEWDDRLDEELRDLDD